MDQAEPRLQAQVAHGRRRPQSAEAWAKIHPILKNYYIDLDMTLQDAMQIIAEEHGFSATLVPVSPCGTAADTKYAQ